MLHDLRFALRVLLKSRAFTAVVVITMALGIGVNACTAPWLTIVGVSPPVFQQSPTQDLSVEPTRYA